VGLENGSLDDILRAVSKDSVSFVLLNGIVKFSRELGFSALAKV
jgi:hypothetical protein